MLETDILNMRPTPPVETVLVTPFDPSVEQLVEGLLLVAASVVLGPRAVYRLFEALGHPISRSDARKIFFAVRAVLFYVRPGRTLKQSRGPKLSEILDKYVESRLNGLR